MAVSLMEGVVPTDPFFEPERFAIPVLARAQRHAGVPDIGCKFSARHGVLAHRKCIPDGHDLLWRFIAASSHFAHERADRELSIRDDHHLRTVILAVAERLADGMTPDGSACNCRKDPGHAADGSRWHAHSQTRDCSELPTFYRAPYRAPDEPQISLENGRA